MNHSTQTKIAAEGRMLSQKNANRIKSVWLELSKLLIDGDVINNQATIAEIQQASSAVEKDSGNGTNGSSGRDDEILAAAGIPNFKEIIQRTTWHERLRATLQLFNSRFRDLHVLPDRDLETFFGKDTDRARSISALIEDLRTVLKELSQDHPGAEDLKQAYPYMDMPMSLSSGASVKDGETEAGKQLLPVAFDFPTPIEASSRSTSHNRQPIEGVLFRIDEPSESAPSVGPRLPLYIPASTAKEIVDGVSGLPLDADDSLSCHANEDIAGVMLSASIDDKDFVVRGLLWPWSRSTKVQRIAANKSKLGMSMNANALGHEAEVNGRKVFWVDQLQLLGANILFSDRATFRQTRLIAALAADDTTEVRGEDATSAATQVAAEASDWSVQSEITEPLDETDGDPELGIASEQPKELEDFDEIFSTMPFDPSSDRSTTIPLSANEVGGLEIELEESLPDPALESEPPDWSAPIPESNLAVHPTQAGTLLIEEETKMDAEIRSHLDNISRGLDSLAGLAVTVETLQAQVSEIQKERTDNQAAIQAAQAQQNQEAQQMQLASLIQQQVEAAFTKHVNPSGQPARRTVPLAAAAAQLSSDPHKMSLQLQMASVEGQLKQLRGQSGGRYNGVEEMQLMDSLREIQAQLSS